MSLWKVWAISLGAALAAWLLGRWLLRRAMAAAADETLSNPSAPPASKEAVSALLDRVYARQHMPEDLR